MNTIFMTIQFILVVIICVCVLLQKSSSMGLGAYSGSNESLFGAKGPAGFLAKFTFLMGFLLVANTVFLGYSYNKHADQSAITKESIEKAKSALPQAIKSTTSQVTSNESADIKPSENINEVKSEKEGK